VITLLLAALGLTALTVFIHGVGAVKLGSRFSTRWAAMQSRPGRLLAERMITLLVSALLLLHLAEAIVWAVFLVAVGAMPDLETAAYFSLTSYTTLGYGDVTLPARWRLLGPLEGAVGVLMFAWSTGVLAAALNLAYRPAAVPGREPR
jgi:voltage-gated potassium channel